MQKKLSNVPCWIKLNLEQVWRSHGELRVREGVGCPAVAASAVTVALLVGDVWRGDRIGLLNSSQGQ